jgi:nitroimidazol reductase NimA-like FMN-containing flavoprotein (pyridoxamine 5'-phosphate oxidase superfamily)
MRRTDREVKEFDEIVEIIKKCDVCRLALNDEEYPYILPLNFGMCIENGKVVLYFHGANVGKKYDLIAKDNKASFEMDCGHRLVTEDDTGNCTMEFESVIGRGIVEIVPDNEKLDALKILMNQYHKDDFIFNQAFVPQTTVFKLTVDSMTGKRRKK